MCRIEVVYVAWCVGCGTPSTSTESPVAEHDPPCEGDWRRVERKAPKQSGRGWCPECLSKVSDLPRHVPNAPLPPCPTCFFFSKKEAHECI